VALRRAGYVHDLGRVAISAAIWGAKGPLSDAQWESVRLHPYHCERVLARSPALCDVAALGSLHHERLDGSGYHRAASSQAISQAARVLAAADVLHALCEPRPHRPALDAREAAVAVRDEVRSGRLDGDAAEAVLTAAGHGANRRRTHVAGLTTRALEVLRLVARDYTMREIAEALTIAPKTADAHLQHIYAKIGVSTRAGATLFAARNDLLEPVGSD
jgi:HD-GYP domain-containing protein (c-di-GMP phosphodiesterase class II)